MKRKRMQHNPLNLPLVIGYILLVAILFLMLFPALFSDKSPYTIQHMRFQTVDGGLTAEKAPYKPSIDYPLGSDDLGRDIWSFIVYGTRTTILIGLLAALLQFAVAIPMALLGGMGHKGIKSFTHYINLFFSAIPALLLSVLVLQIDFFGGLPRIPSLLVFIFVLTMAGWPRLGTLLLERVESLNNQAFVLGEVAIGKKKINIALENIVPHLAPEAIVLFFMEVARNLSMMMQLGLFGVFIGNLRLIMDADRGNMTYYNISYEPEWASMLSTSRTYLTMAPWTVLFPAMAFFISVLGFNLFGEGLRSLLQARGTAIVTVVRHIVTLDYSTLIKSIHHRRKIWIAGGTGLLSIAVLAFFLQSSPAKFSFDSVQKLPQQTVIVGTSAADETAEMIAQAMSGLGMVPAEGTSFLLPYAIPNSQLLTVQQLTIHENKEAPAQTLEPGIDFSFVATAQYPLFGEMIDLSSADLYAMTDFKPLKDHFVLIDSAFYTDDFLRYIIAKIGNAVPVTGVLLVARDDSMLENPILEAEMATSVIRISRQVGMKLQNMDNPYIKAVAKTEPLSNKGVNVAGIYRSNPLTNPASEEFIAVGLRYNYLNDTGRDVLRFNLALMQQLCRLSENRRSLLFVFLDGTLSDTVNGIQPFSNDTPLSAQKIKLYLDLTDLGSAGKLALSTKQAPITRQFAWSMGQMLSTSLSKEVGEIRDYESVRNGNEYWLIDSIAANAMFWNAGIASIRIGGIPDKLDTLGNILLEVIHKNNY